MRAPAPPRLLDRLLDMPHLAHLVPRLPPETLHRVIQTAGLEDCGELVALATPGQLQRVFDLDLWGGEPGVDERFDADRFGVWLEVLLESGAAAAARTVAEMDVDLVIAALAQHARVFDPAANSPSEDGDDVAAAGSPRDEPGCDVGGYHIVASRTASWDAIVAVLIALDDGHHDYFHRVMQGCRSLSNGGFEVDGLDDLLTEQAQVMFDLAIDREQRREKQGYMTPAQARAFLQMARQRRPGPDTTPPANPVARAYFRALEWTTAEADRGSRRLPAASGAAPAPEDLADGVAAIVDVLLEAGVLTSPPRALLDGPQGHAPRLARIRAHLQFARDSDEAAFSTMSQELAFLANTIVAGCSIQARPLTSQEASDAAMAVCNLGLENWRPQWLQPQDLVSVFQVGWTVLYEDVCTYAAEALLGILTRLRCDDRETQAGLHALRLEMAEHCAAGVPWRAREALDVIASLDMPAWAALLGLIDEYPVLHAGIGASQRSGTRAVSASAFEFISENSQIATIRAFMQSLPDTLGLDVPES